MKKSLKLIEKIKSEHIEPIPKWYFTTKNILVWVGFAVSVFIGAAAFSIILFSIQQTDFNLVSHLSHSRLEMFLGLLPFFWIITLVVFLVAAIYSIYHSKKGYKLKWSILVGISVALSILLGTLFFIGGGAGKLEQAFAVRVSLYESIQEKKEKIWMMPEEGYLSGIVESVKDSSFQLTDFDNNKWEVDFRGAFVPPVVFLEKGEQVKLVGKMKGEGSFKADEVRPWGGPKNRSERLKRMKERK